MDALPGRTQRPWRRGRPKTSGNVSGVVSLEEGHLRCSTCVLCATCVMVLFRTRQNISFGSLACRRLCTVFTVLCGPCQMRLFSPWASFSHAPVFCTVFADQQIVFHLWASSPELFGCSPYGNPLFDCAHRISPVVPLCAEHAAATIFTECAWRTGGQVCHTNLNAMLNVSRMCAAHVEQKLGSQITLDESDLHPQFRFHLSSLVPLSSRTQHQIPDARRGNKSSAVDFR